MRLILNGVEPLHWAVAGAAIAGITLLLLFVSNRRLGISIYRRFKNSFLCALRRESAIVGRRADALSSLAASVVPGGAERARIRGRGGQVSEG